jgi:hypothetical protein
MIRSRITGLPVSLLDHLLQQRSNLCCEEIHGRPYKPVLNAPGIPSKIGHSGYCPHSMALFLGWHRPYLALFEVRYMTVELSCRF